MNKMKELFMWSLLPIAMITVTFVFYLIRNIFPFIPQNWFSISLNIASILELVFILVFVGLGLKEVIQPHLKNKEEPKNGTNGTTETKT